MSGTGWRIGVGSVRTHSGQAVEFGRGLNILVGPNNAGKTSFLQDLQLFSQNFGSDGHLKVLQHYIPFTEGSAEEVGSWLSRHKRVKGPFKWGKVEDSVRGPELIGMSGEREKLAQEIWDSGVYFPYPSLSHITNLYVRNRLQLVDPVEAQDPTREDFPSNAIHVMYEDESLEAQWSALVEKAFGKSVSIWRDAGPMIRLVSGRSRVTVAERPQYQEEMRTKVQLPFEGDGLVAYAGIMLQVLADDNPVVLIDEPEAFLHPPQARILGQELASIGNRDKQLIVATHSIDIVRGAFSSANSDNLNVMRLTRSGDMNYLQRIPEDTLQDLIFDPLLRHSAVLDGLFYDGVVITEGDGDATYYGLVNDSINAEQPIAQSGGQRSPDVLFTHANGGYSRFPQAMRALRSLNVPCACVLDVDVLGDIVVLDRILNSLKTSIDLLGIRSQLTNITNTLSQRSAAPRREHFRDAIDPIVKSQERYLSDREIKQVRSVVSASSGWRFGASQNNLGLRGDELKSFLAIVDALKEVGVFVVKVGQLEGFHPEFNPEPKVNWLSSVMENEAFASDGDHSQFVKQIVAYLAGQGRTEH